MNSEIEVMVVHAAFEDVAKIVALVDIPVEIEDDIEALEYAYRWTQNIHGSWSRSETLNEGQKNEDFNWRVKRIGDLPTHLGETLGMRSTSVRDYMSVVTKMGEIRRYRVTGMGFDRVTDAEFPMVEGFDA